MLCFHLDDKYALSHDFSQFCSSCTISIEVSVCYSLEQNGASEWSGGVIISKARSLLIDAGLLKFLWPDAFKAATYLINHSPTRLPVGDDAKFEWVIPLLHMATCLDILIPLLNLSNLCVYRCYVYVHIPVQT